MANPDFIYYKETRQGAWRWRLEIMPHDGTYRPLTGAEQRVPIPEGFIVTNALTYGWEMPKTPLGWCSAQSMKVTVNIGALVDYAPGSAERELHHYIQQYGGTVWTLLSNAGDGTGSFTHVEFQGMTSYYHGEQFKYNQNTRSNTTELELISTAKLACERTLLSDVATYCAAQCSTIPDTAYTNGSRNTYTTFNRVVLYETIVYDNSTGPGLKFVYGRRANSSYTAGDEEHACMVRFVDFYDTIEYLLAGQFSFLTRGSADTSTVNQTRHCSLLAYEGNTQLSFGGYCRLTQYKQDYTAAGTRGSALALADWYMAAFVGRVSNMANYYSGLLGDTTAGLQKEYKNCWDLFADETDAGMCCGYTETALSPLAGEYKLQVHFNALWLPQAIQSIRQAPAPRQFGAELAFGLKGHQSSGCVANIVEPLENDVSEQRYLSNSASQNLQQFQVRCLLNTSPSANIDMQTFYDALSDGADGDFSGPDNTKCILFNGGFNFAKVYYRQAPVSLGGAYAWINGSADIFVRCYHAPTVSLGDIDSTPMLLTSYAVAVPITPFDGTATGAALLQQYADWLTLYQAWAKEVQQHGWPMLAAQVSGMLTARGDCDVTEGSIASVTTEFNSFSLYNNPSARFQIAPADFDALYKPTLPRDSVLIKSETTVAIPGTVKQSIKLWTKAQGL